MTSAAEVMMSEEDRAAMASEAGDPNRSTSPNPQTAASPPPVVPTSDAATTPSQPSVGNNVGPVPPIVTPDSAPHAGRTDSGLVKHEGSGAATPTSAGKEKDKKGKNKLSPEQRKKLEELDAQRKKVMEER